MKNDRRMPSGVGIPNADNLKIGILGMGHIGIPTAVSLAELGWEVIGADLDSAKIDLIKTGQCPFYEPGLDELLKKHISTSRLTVTDDVSAAIRSAQVLFICVWTSQKENGEADLTHLESLARLIARNINEYKLIIEKSTVPAGTGKWIKKTVERYYRAEQRRGGKNGSHNGHGEIVEFDVASNPEFLQEGRAVENILHPDRIVCGTNSQRAERILREIYRPYACPIVMTDLTTAETIKHTANAFLATKISFINMIADFCEAVGADVSQVACGIGLDPRVGPGFLNPGLGFGGYCLPKDLKALTHIAKEHGLDLSLLKEVERINQKRIDVFLRKVREAVWVVRDKTIGLLGLAFKPETDDVREAPSSRIVESLLREGANLQLFDPQAMENFRINFPEQPGQLTYCDSAYDAARGAHALLVVTEWDEFLHLDLPRLHDLMEVPVLVDGRNLYDPEMVLRCGFEYFSIGRETLRHFPPLEARFTPVTVQSGEARSPLEIVQSRPLARGKI